MKMDKRLEFYLRNSDIEFRREYLLEVIPQDEKEAVILTAPKGLGEHSYFHFQYRSASFYFGTIEQMLDYCIERGYLNRRAADKLIKEYRALRGDV